MVGGARLCGRGRARGRGGRGPPETRLAGARARDFANVLWAIYTPNFGTVHGS